MPYKVSATGRWAAQGRVSGKRVQLGTFPTKREAAAAEAAHKRARPTSDVTVAEWQRVWLGKRGWKESTRQHNAERTKAFVDEHGKKRIAAINRTVARDFLAEHPSCHGALSAMFGAAMYEDGDHGDPLLQHNPFSRLMKRTTRRRDLQSEWMDGSVVDALEACARRVLGPVPGEVAASMVRFAAETGIRPGELFLVGASDLDPDAGVLAVRWAADSKTRTVERPKNGRPREVVLSRRAAEAAQRAQRLIAGPQRIIPPRLLATASPAEVAPTALIFCAPGGKQFWNSGWGYYWHQIRAAAGRPGMDFYELRHFAATRLIEAGLDDRDVATQLGHTDGGELVRKVYGHPSERLALKRIRAVLNNEEN